jgi:hypothetical protein
MPSNSHRVVQNNLTANGMIRPTWRALPVDVIDELEDYSEMYKGTSHANIYSAALHDVKAQPEPVDLLLNARVKTKKKKREYHFGPLFARSLTARLDSSLCVKRS